MIEAGLSGKGQGRSYRRRIAVDRRLRRMPGVTRVALFGARGHLFSIKPVVDVAGCDVFHLQLTVVAESVETLYPGDGILGVSFRWARYGSDTAGRTSLTANRSP